MQRVDRVLWSRIISSIPEPVQAVYVGPSVLEFTYRSEVVGVMIENGLNNEQTLRYMPDKLIEDPNAFNPPHLSEAVLGAAKEGNDDWDSLDDVVPAVNTRHTLSLVSTGRGTVQ